MVVEWGVATALGRNCRVIVGLLVNQPPQISELFLNAYALLSYV